MVLLSVIFLFPGAIFCPMLSLFLFCPSFHPFLWSFLGFFHRLLCPWTVHSVSSPLATLLVTHHFFQPGPFSGPPSTLGSSDGHPPSLQRPPLLFLGGKLQSLLPFRILWAGSCHTLGSRENLLSALMPPSTPLPPHPREGADRSPGPLHS